MDLIVGLGNPGRRYKETRHNIGYQVINAWSLSVGIRLNGRRFQSRNTQTIFMGKKIILLRPVTFMNESGRSVKGCADYYDIKKENILVIHDDVDLPVGRIKVVRNGGAAGHKGVLSTIHSLGTMQFPRIKIGIGRPRGGEAVEDYVLAPFYRDQKVLMKRVIHMAIRACELFVSDGIESTMNQINCHNLAIQEGTS